MRHLLLSFIAVAALALALPTDLSARRPCRRPFYGGPGLVIAMKANPSTMPIEIRGFVDKYFPGADIVSAQRDMFPQHYDIVLSNGVSLVFDEQGRPQEMDCPAKKSLSADTQQELMELTGGSIAMAW